MTLSHSGRQRLRRQWHADSDAPAPETSRLGRAIRPQIQGMGLPLAAGASQSSDSAEPPSPSESESDRGSRASKITRADFKIATKSQNRSGEFKSRNGRSQSRRGCPNAGRRCVTATQASVHSRSRHSAAGLGRDRSLSRSDANRSAAGPPHPVASPGAQPSSDSKTRTPSRARTPADLPVPGAALRRPCSDGIPRAARKRRRDCRRSIKPASRRSKGRPREFIQPAIYSDETWNPRQ